MVPGSYLQIVSTSGEINYVGPGNQISVSASSSSTT